MPWDNLFETWEIMVVMIIPTFMITSQKFRGQSLDSRSNQSNSNWNIHSPESYRKISTKWMWLMNCLHCPLFQVVFRFRMTTDDHTWDGPLRKTAKNTHITYPYCWLSHKNDIPKQEHHADRHGSSWCSPKNQWLCYAILFFGTQLTMFPSPVSSKVVVGATKVAAKVVDGTMSEDSRNWRTRNMRMKCVVDILNCRHMVVETQELISSYVLIIASFMGLSMMIHRWIRWIHGHCDLKKRQME